MVRWFDLTCDNTIVTLLDVSFAPAELSDGHLEAQNPSAVSPYLLYVSFKGAYALLPAQVTRRLRYMRDFTLRSRDHRSRGVAGLYPVRYQW